MSPERSVTYLSGTDLRNMVSAAGFEPATHALKGSPTQLQTTTCTSSLRHGRHKKINEMRYRSGCPEGARSSACRTMSLQFAGSFVTTERLRFRLYGSAWQAPWRAVVLCRLSTTKQTAQCLTIHSHVLGLRFEEGLPSWVRFSAALQAAHACPHPADLLQDYSFHSLDCGFSGRTTGGNSNFSSSSFVSRGTIQRPRWTENDR